MKNKALEACDYQTSLRALNQLVNHLKIFEYYHASPLLEAIEKNPDDLEELVDQFLWINTSLGNWSYVLRALELKVKLTGKEKQEWDYEEMLNSLELLVRVCGIIKSTSARIDNNLLNVLTHPFVPRPDISQEGRM